MNNEILTKAKNIIAERKITAERNAEENLQKAIQNPEFKALYNKYISEMIESAKSGKTSKNTAELQKKCEIWLKNHKLLPLQPQYACKKCQDCGSVDGQYCDCLKREITRLLIAQSGFDKLESFDSAHFDIFDEPKKMQTLYAKMKEWCSQSHPTKTLIFLSGNTGVGKTHLVKCMANELINRNQVVNLTTAFALNQDLVKAYTSFDSDLRESTLQKYLDCSCLFIDDLGTEIKQRGISVNMLYLILNERKMRGLCTVITSNLDLKDIFEQYDERIFSRIVDKDASICIRLDGKDQRVDNAKLEQTKKRP